MEVVRGSRVVCEDVHSVICGLDAIINYEEGLFSKLTEYHRRIKHGWLFLFQLSLSLLHFSQIISRIDGDSITINLVTIILIMNYANFYSAAYR